ncbi:MAG: Omp28-related outer membrane protein [Flavobacteriales bacterium]|nr:Omp28-related outer membrane protein [Flavobacteriales bacterium]
MKKALTLFALAPAFAFGQSLVSTDPQNRTALLEDFTGIHCGYCPEGHVIMADLAAVHGDQLVNVGIHANVYAVPSGSEPDFRTPDGDALDTFFPITGYPNGVINRRNYNNLLAMGRGAWEGAVNAALALPSPVNVGVESSINGNELTVHVVGYYTANSGAGSDYISVLVMEDHLNGPQTDYANGNHANYDHLHVLRDYISDTWGEDVGDHTAGETVERTYTYTLPGTWNVANLKVVAFISEYQSEVYQAREVAADGGTTLVIGALQSDALAYRAGTEAASTTFDGSFANALNADEDYVITLTSYGSPVTWANSFTVDGVAQSNPATITVASGGTVDLDVIVTPDAAPGIGKYTLSVASSTNGGAPVLTAEYHVISNVHDLVVNNPQAEAHEPLYTNGMWNENYKAVTTRADFVAFGEADALTDVLNLYLNISWTFPSYTDAVANVLSAFLDNGGNLMIAGQDIGWDQSGVTGAYGTPVTQAFYADYLHATYVADGSNADTQVLWEDADAVFGLLGNSTIIDAFGGNTYPEQITPIAPAVPIMRYSPTKIGALRCETGGYKVVYFGIGPEQVASQAIAQLMVQASHDWFYGLVSVEEFDAMMNNLGQAYPSPAASQVSIPVGEFTGAASLEVFDATGRMVMTERVSAKSTMVTLYVEHLNNGFYTARLRTSEGSGVARNFQVIH